MRGRLRKSAAILTMEASEIQMQTLCSLGPHPRPVDLQVDPKGRGEMHPLTPQLAQEELSGGFKVSRARLEAVPSQKTIKFGLTIRSRMSCGQRGRQHSRCRARHEPALCIKQIRFQKRGFIAPFDDAAFSFDGASRAGAQEGGFQF